MSVAVVATVAAAALVAAATEYTLVYKALKRAVKSRSEQKTELRMVK